MSTILLQLRILQMVPETTQTYEENKSDWESFEASRAVLPQMM
ncbi:MAG: hypothetical protein ACLRH0_06815 [Blautia wexlerae]